MFYAGVGSRRTPAPVLGLMTRCASRLFTLGFTLRSGGCPGPDQAFEAGAGDCKEIFLPTAGWQGNLSQFTSPSKVAMDMAASIHPAWHRCSAFARLLHARNVHQVLGPDCSDPVQFVLCYTPDGAEYADQCNSYTGGTGMAIRIACAHAVPVFNMANEDALVRLREHLEWLGVAVK